MCLVPEYFEILCSYGGDSALKVWNMEENSISLLQAFQKNESGSSHINFVCSKMFFKIALIVSRHLEMEDLS